MRRLSKALITVIDKIKRQGVSLAIDDLSTKIDIDLDKIDFLKVKPFIYYLLNNFENSYFITIENIPYCLMPDAAHHIVYRRIEDVEYLKSQECNRCKYTNICPGIKKSFKLNRSFTFSLVRDLPEEIVLEVTQSCNLNCLLCFRQKKSEGLSLDRIKEIIDDCNKLGIRDIRFTGGEPLLYRDIENALSYAKEKGLYTILNTNGTVLNKDLKRIVKLYVDNILISLQGYNYSSNERLTQRKIDFKQKLKNIIELKLNVPIVRVGTIISKTLIENMNKFLILIEKLGIKSWDFYRPMASKEIEEFTVTKRQLINLIGWIKKVRENGKVDVHISNPIPFCMTKDFFLSRYVIFGAERDDGHSRLIVDSVGFRPSYPIYKYLGKTIEEAWENPFLKKIRSLSYLPDKCKSCFYLNWCKGGSRYLAKLEYGSYFEPDPLMR